MLTLERENKTGSTIQRRFNDLEKRRLAFTQRIFSLTVEQLNQRPIPKAFTAGELMEHFTLTEKVDLNCLHQTPPSSLVGKKANPTFVYWIVLEQMSKAEVMAPTLPSMTPRGAQDIQQSAKNWQNVRTVLREYIEPVTDPDSAFCKMAWYLGILSLNQYLDLMEAHMHYHEVRFPVT